MTKAFCKLQGFVFTILSSNMTFGPCSLLFWLFLSVRKKKKGGRKGKYHSRLEARSEERKAIITAGDGEREREWVSIRRLSSAHLHLSLTWERGRLWSCLAEHVNSHSSNDYICRCQTLTSSRWGWFKQNMIIIASQHRSRRVNQLWQRVWLVCQMQPEYLQLFIFFRMWEWILSVHFSRRDFRVRHLDADENGLSHWLNAYFKDKRTSASKKKKNCPQELNKKSRSPSVMYVLNDEL